MAESNEVMLYDFEAQPHQYRLGAEDSLTPAEATGHIDHQEFKDGAASFRIDFDIPRNGAGLFINHVELHPRQLPDDLWGIEAWCRMDAPHPLMIEFLIEEDDGELWTAGAHLRNDALATDWHRVAVPFDWINLLSWTRDNARLDTHRIKTIRPFVKKWEGWRQASGSLWLDSIRLVSAERLVTAQRHGDFQLLDLSHAFDSDSIAWKNNPTDGDFHTGDWEPRTIPAEHMPQSSVTELRGVPLLMPPYDDGADNTIRCNGQQLIGFPQDGYSALFVLATGKFGDHAADLTLHYADGGVEQRAFRISDAGRRGRYGDVPVIRFPFVYHEHRIDDRQPELYIQSVRVNPGRRLTAITLPHHDLIKIFAISLSTSTAPPPVGAMFDQPLGVVDPMYHMPDTLDLDFSQPVRPAGALGAYLRRRPSNYRLENPGFNGFLTVSANADEIPQHRLYFDKLDNREPPFSIGGISTPGYMSSPLRFNLLDSTCIENSVEITSRNNQRFEFKVTGSRAWPAVLYETTAPRFYWFDPDEGGSPRITMAQNDGVKTIDLESATALPIPSEPWILIWHSPGDGERRKFDAPVLLVLEKRPQAIRAERNEKTGGVHLWFHYDGSGARVAAMPLFGIRRLDMSETQRWAKESLPIEIAGLARIWTQRLQYFPVALSQLFDMDEAEGRLTITDRFDWIQLESEWEVEARRFTPLPPVAMLAKLNNYPIQLDASAIDSGMAAIAGPLWGVEAEESKYSIPLTVYSEYVLAPARLEGHPLSGELHEEFERLINNMIPKALTPRTLRSDTAHDLAMQRIIAPSGLLTGHGRNSQHRRDYGRAVINNALSDEHIKLESEPLTGQFYLMDNRFWAADREYDKEWAIGFMLQGLWHYAWYQDGLETIQPHWNRILGLYRYYQIFFDWANSTTWTMATGAGANSDGMRIAWEGMVCMARLARAAGDEATYRDARIRASRQMMSLFASWFAPQWAVDQNYVMRANRHIPADQAETRFSPDVIWVETFTCNTCRPRDFFQVTHAFYIYNLAQMLFLHDFKLDELKLRPWIMEAVPEYHPNWADGNAVVDFNKQYYGNNATMAHLVVRSLLLHQDVNEVFEYYKSSTRHTESVKQWYTPMGQAPLALAAMQTGAGPAAIVPLDGWRIAKNVYDFAGKLHHTDLTSTRAARGLVKFWCWEGAPEAITINGAPVEWNWDANLKYAIIEIEAFESGQSIKIDMQFEIAEKLF